MSSSNNAICIFCACTGGGTGTLTIRMAGWCARHGVRLCHCAYIDSDRLNTAVLRENNARLETCDDESYLEQFTAAYEAGYEYTAVVYTLEDYHKAEKIQIKFPAVKKILLYVILRDGLCYNLRNGARWGDALSRAVTRTVNRRYIKKVSECGCLLFMDEQCLSQTEKMAEVSFSDKNAVIARLPYEITDYGDRIGEHIFRGEVFTISTAARLDFPFKGYVIGLIEVFAELKKRYRELRLIIVGDGKDGRTVEEAVRALEPDIRKDVELAGMLSYDELKNVLSETDLYIGMGTTLLDAADNLTPAMTAAAFTYELETIGLFSEHPEKLGIDPGAEKAATYIESVINMPDSCYCETVLKQYDNLKRIYSIDSFMKKVLEYERPNYRLADEPLHSAIYEIFVKVLKARRLIRKFGHKKEEAGEL